MCPCGCVRNVRRVCCVLCAACAYVCRVVMYYTACAHVRRVWHVRHVNRVWYVQHVRHVYSTGVLITRR